MCQDLRKYSWVASDTKREFRVRAIEGLSHISLSLQSGCRKRRKILNGKCRKISGEGKEKQQSIII